MRSPATLALIAICALAMPCHAVSAKDGTRYARIGFGVAENEASRLRDDECAATAPPALYGCGQGIDGQPLGTPIDFGAAATFDLAVGRQIARNLRGELGLGVRARQQLHGNANFRGAGDSQPVNAETGSTAAFAAIYWDVPSAGIVRPFLGAGVGMARTRTSAMTYRFPDLSATSATIMPATTRLSPAILLTAGIAIPAGNRFHIDMAWRYEDLGRLESGPGDATIVRHSGNRTIAIAGTWASLHSHAASISVRRTF